METFKQTIRTAERITTMSSQLRGPEEYNTCGSQPHSFQLLFDSYRSLKSKVAQLPFKVVNMSQQVLLAIFIWKIVVIKLVERTSVGLPGYIVDLRLNRLKAFKPKW